MAFSSIKNDLSARVRGSFENLAVQFGGISVEDGVEYIVGSRVPDGVKIKASLSSTRKWSDRKSLSESLVNVEVGCLIILNETERNGDAYSIRFASPINTRASEVALVNPSHFARVGEPALYENGWVQAVEVVHAAESVACTSYDETVAAIMKALGRSEIGGQGFVVRAIDSEGVAVSVRFRRVWDAQNLAFKSEADSFNAFLASDNMVQGLGEKMAGWEFLEIIQDQAVGLWEVIPITSFNMRGKQVDAAGEGHGRNRAASYRYNFTKPEAGTGFVPSLIAVGKSSGYYCREAMPVKGGVAPVALPYIPTPHRQPVYVSEHAPKGPVFLPSDTAPVARAVQEQADAEPVVVAAHVSATPQVQVTLPVVDADAIPAKPKPRRAKASAAQVSEPEKSPEVTQVAANELPDAVAQEIVDMAMQAPEPVAEAEVVAAPALAQSGVFDVEQVEDINEPISLDAFADELESLDLSSLKSVETLSLAPSM